MQLKLRRTQRDGGVISKNVIFCLDARAEFTAEEAQNLRRYKLHRQVIYNSDASKQLLERSAAQQDGSFKGSLKGLGSLALAAMKLNITVASLENGQYIECKSMDELLGAEDALMTACENLKGYLETAATFDGREVVIDFNSEGPKVVAFANPSQEMAAPQPVPAASAAAAVPQLTTTMPSTPANEAEDAEWEPVAEASAAEEFYYPTGYEQIIQWCEENKTHAYFVAGIVVIFIFSIAAIMAG